MTNGHRSFWGGMALVTAVFAACTSEPECAGPGGLCITSPTADDGSAEEGSATGSGGGRPFGEGGQGGGMGVAGERPLEEGPDFDPDFSSGARVGTGGTAGSAGGGFNTAGKTSSVGGRFGQGGDASEPQPLRHLGRSCADDEDCHDGEDRELFCFRASDPVPGYGAPPGGICTKACVASSDCSTLDMEGSCHSFGLDSNLGYCVQRCEFGDHVGATKCHGRVDFACDALELLGTDEPCTSSAHCQDGELCVEGSCHVVFPSCLPACRGDLDCAPGLYCDQSFLSGVCTTTEQVGKGLGEPCTIPSADDPSEPDECLGFCQVDSPDSSKGYCAQSCGLANACAWNPATELFDGVCFNASIFAANGGQGDFGFCTPSCNCTSDCHDPELGCTVLPGGRLGDDFYGAGLCFANDPEVEEVDECESGP